MLLAPAAQLPGRPFCRGALGHLVPPDLQQAEARTRLLFHASQQTNDLCSCHQRQKLVGWPVPSDVWLQEQATSADYSGEQQVCAKEYSLLGRASFLLLFVNKPDPMLRIWDWQSESKLNTFTLKACWIKQWAPEAALHTSLKNENTLLNQHA